MPLTDSLTHDCVEYSFVRLRTPYLLFPFTALLQASEAGERSLRHRVYPVESGFCTTEPTITDP